MPSWGRSGNFIYPEFEAAEPSKLIPSRGVHCCESTDCEFLVHEAGADG